MSDIFRGLMFLVVMCAGVSAQGRTTENFNANWKFDRFGAMPDGSRRSEPGSVGTIYELRASSEESAKGNNTEHAFDNDRLTRWCAANSSSPQWLGVDLLKPMYVKNLKVIWETDAAGYKADVLISNGGASWKKISEVCDGAPAQLNTTARLIKIKVKSCPPRRWASIREIELRDKRGALIKNIRPAKAGEVTPENVAYDDSSWRSLSLPHDWAIEGPFRYDLEGNTGKLPWRGIGWYRKSFKVDSSDSGRKIFIDFDGAMANSKVWCNGEYVGGHPYGYQGFRLDLTPYIKFGEKNLIAVRLDTEKWGSRWYPGAGIYRNVRLVKTDVVHVGQWGAYITTPELSDQSGTAHVVVSVDNNGKQAVSADVRSVICKYSSGKLGSALSESKAARLDIAAGETAKAALDIVVANPERWDINSPSLYLCRTKVSVKGRVVDEYDTVFGFRTIKFTPRDGFFINGRRVAIQGVCNHHDLGALGSAVNRRAVQRQLEILKKMGCNAIRTSHNPPAPELLELCDEMGFVVMCEAFDCWIGGKKAYDYSVLYKEWHKKDLEDMVRHFVNHPSIVLWSTGNEIREQHTENPAKELRDIVHAADPSRPVSCGVWDGAARSNFRKGVDVFGLNYGIGHYGKLLKYPGNENLPFFASESSSCISSRGEYFFGMKRSDFQITSYDTDHPGWGCTPDQEFAALDRNPAFMGEFVWTGFDYIGEPTPYNSDMSNLLNIHDKDPVKLAAMKKELEELGKIRTPSRSSYFGIIDLAGFPKDRYYLYQARWRPDYPMVHILPHWNWPERIGKVTPVHVYTSGDEAELFLNGKSLGKKKKGEYEYRLRWDDVVYEPGELKAVAYKDGKVWAETVMKTTGAAYALEMSADRNVISADGEDLAFITVKVADKNGLMVPRAKNHIKFKIVGPGSILAVDNGDATSFEPFQASERNAFNGLALVIVKSKKGKSGKIMVEAAADGLKSDIISIKSEVHKK